MPKPVKKAATSAKQPPATVDEAVAKYQEVFDGIARFVSIIEETEGDIYDADAKVAEAKAAYDAAKQDAASIRELRDGAKQ